MPYAHPVISTYQFPPSTTFDATGLDRLVSDSSQTIHIFSIIGNFYDNHASVSPSAAAIASGYLSSLRTTN